MSSAGGAISGESRQYFCHQCDRTVSISTSSADLACPICNGSFVEELETPIPIPNPIPPLFSYTTDFPVAAAGFPFDDLSAFLGNNRSSPPPFNTGGPEPFNPLEFFQNYLQARVNSFPNFQFVIQNAGDATGAFRIPGNANPGDYFFGPGLEELIQQLAENDPNRRGPPPASKSAVEALPDITVTEELLATDSAQCAVCKDTFELGETVKQMPCKHIYHKDCILPWLELHNSCPVCRYELPTDDPDYEQRNRGGSDDAGGDGDDSQRRRFRVTLPWQFRQVSSSSGAETSNVGNVNNNNSSSNSGNNNEQSNGNRNFDSETRQEDLD